MQKRDHRRSSNGSSYTFPSTCHLHFHQKITANNSAHGGVHPIVSLESHQENLSALISKALWALPNAGSPDDDNRQRDGGNIALPIYAQPPSRKVKPDFISVTRGPGMRSSLTTGLDTAKGLAVAWQVPLVGVNHMQAHALTPRLVSALNDRPDENGPNKLAYDPHPAFSFLSLLVSGGHTLLLHSSSLTTHSILATTTDIAIGDCIDKIARLVLPHWVTNSTTDTMYGRLLEKFAFPAGSSDYTYIAPTTRALEIARKETKWGWVLGPPLAETRSGSKSRAMEFTFSGLGSAVKRITESKPNMSDGERVDLAREAMRLAFEHLASRVGWALKDLDSKGQGVKTLVVSGGVASNRFLRTVYAQPPSPNPTLSADTSPSHPQPPLLPHGPRLPRRQSHLPARRTLH